MTGEITVYSTTWCPYCLMLKRSLGRAGIAFTEIDIGEHPDAARLVAGVNGGNETVPTVVMPDGTALTNPSVREIKAALVG